MVEVVEVYSSGQHYFTPLRAKMLYCRILGQVGENFIPLVPDAPSEEFAHIPEINHKPFSIDKGRSRELI